VLPNLVVIGAAKSGTSSLHHYLGAHPEIAMSEPKELFYFVLEKNWPLGREWYESHFTVAAPVRGESTPAYTQHPYYSGVPERMATVLPQDVKFIYILRDPLDRILSNFRFAYFMDDSAEALVRQVMPFETSGLVARSRYFWQLERYLEHFSSDRFLVMDMARLIADPVPEMARAFRFLGVDDTFASPRFTEQLNMTRPSYGRARGHAIVRTADRLLGEERSLRLRMATPHVLHAPFVRQLHTPDYPPDVREDLIEFLRPDVERVREFSGLPFESWCL
jgi:hypothetical protein